MSASGGCFHMTPSYTFTPQNEGTQFTGCVLGKRVLPVFTYAEVMILNVFWVRIM